MTNHISSRDWEAISAYLDEQLDRRERSRLETRLQNDQNLRNALEEMRRTRLLLRNLPKMRAPRNYTLTPKMAGVREKSAWTPRFFGFASVLATLLFIMVFVGDYFTPRLPATAPLAAEPSAGEEAPEAPMSALEASEAPAEGPEMGIQALTVPTGTAGVLAGSMPAQETEAPGIMRAMGPEPTVPVQAEDTRIAGGAEETTNPPSAEAATRGFAPFADIDPTSLRALEAGLAVIALATALAAIYLRRGGGS